MQMTLREEDRLFVERELKAGRYATESELVSDALAEFRLREELRAARLDEIRGEVMIGLDQLDAGAGAEWNLQEVIEKGRSLLDFEKTK